MHIRASARKHGILDEDVLHAVRLPVGWRPLDRDDCLPSTFVIGPDRAGNLLELIVVHQDDGIDVVIHAMRLQPRYRKLLPHHGL